MSTQDFTDDIEMKEFDIPCTWQMSGTYHIKAKDLSEAIKQIEEDNLPLPSERAYIEDSFRLDSMDELAGEDDYDTESCPI